MASWVNQFVRRECARARHAQAHGAHPGIPGVRVWVRAEVAVVDPARAALRPASPVPQQ